MIMSYTLIKILGLWFHKIGVFPHFVRLWRIFVETTIGIDDT